VAKKAAKRPNRKPRRARSPHAALKRRILAAIRGTGDKPWTVEDLMPVVGCADRELLLRCCCELVGAGHIGEGPPLPPDWPAAEGLPRGDDSENPPQHMAFDLPPEPTPEQLKEREELQRVSKRLDDFLNAPQRMAAASHEELRKIGGRLDSFLNTQQRATTVPHKELRKAREDLNNVLDAQQRATTVSHKELRKIRERLENFPNAPLPVTVTSSVPLELAKPASAAQTELTEELRKELLGSQSLPYAHKQIRQYATERFGDWRKISSQTIWDTAQKDSDNPVGKGRSLITFERALGRRRSHWRA
jgi:hypothetical protein